MIHLCRSAGKTCRTVATRRNSRSVPEQTERAPTAIHRETASRNPKSEQLQENRPCYGSNEYSMELFRLFLRNNSVYSACLLGCRPCKTESCLIFCQSASPKASRILRAWSNGCAMSCGLSTTHCEPSERIGIGSNGSSDFMGCVIRGGWVRGK